MVCESDRRRVKHPEQSVGVVITGLFSAWDERRGIRKVRGKKRLAHSDGRVVGMSDHFHKNFLNKARHRRVDR